MTVKMKARDLGLDDLRYDVDVTTARGNRVVGQLQRIEQTFGADVISLWLGAATDAIEAIVHDSQTVTVDRGGRKSINHFASKES